MSLPLLLTLPADVRGAVARVTAAAAVTPSAELFADAVRELTPAEIEEPDAAMEEPADTPAVPVDIPGSLSPPKGPTPVDTTPIPGSLSLPKGPTAAEPAPLRQAQGATVETAEQPGPLSPSKGPDPIESTPLRQAQGTIVETSAKGPAPVDAAPSPAVTAASAPIADVRTAPPAEVAPASAPRPALLPQISGPVVALARASNGAHSITLTISPETLGPVTVRARIADGSIRLELHAPSDAGREALKLILVDLRRDLAVAAPQATLSVSTQDAPSTSASGSSGSFAGSPHGRPGSDPTAPRYPESPAPAARRDAPTPPAASPHGGIDVYA